MECNQIDDYQYIVSSFRMADENGLNKVFTCFFKSYFEEFKRLTYKICAGRSYTKYQEYELANNAFADGLLSFYYKLKKDGFDNGGAKLKTYLFTFCIFKLKAAIKQLERNAGREVLTETFFGAGDKSPGYASEDIFSAHYSLTVFTNQEAILNEAFEKLGDRCKNFIIWKKISKLSNEDIALRANIAAVSINNEVYKCFKRLKDFAGTIKNTPQYGNSFTAI